MKIFRTIMFFSAVMMAPALVLYGLVVGSLFMVIFPALLGGYNLYAGIKEMSRE